MYNVAAFTGGKNVPSARFRVRQYTSKLKLEGVIISEFYSRFGCYPPRSKLIRPVWGIATLLNQIPNVIRSYSYDITLFQREILSTFLTLEPLTKRPCVLDVDDAIFLYRNGCFVKHLTQQCDLVICGNSYLANWFSQWNKNIAILPTAVDTKRYVPLKKKHINQNTVIGWIGTSGNFRYLYSIEQSIKKVMEAYSKVQLQIVSDKMPKFHSLDPSRIEFISWSEKKEVEAIQSMDIGIMPLEDSVWARGKCSLKILQYMSCGLPVVAAPVGMNAEILNIGDVGRRADTDSQWVDAISELLDSPELCFKLGAMGRKVVETSFSLEILAPQFANYLKSVIV